MNEFKKLRSRKNAIVYLKTIFWYEYISSKVSINRRIAFENNAPFRLGPDPTEMENHFFLTNVNRVSDFFDQQESAIWYKYFLGKTTPNKKTLEMCDNKISDSSTYFQHPIWELLEKFPTPSNLKTFYSILPATKLNYLPRKLPMDLTKIDAGDIWIKWDTNKKIHLFLLINFLDFVGFIVYTYYKCLYKLQFEKVNNVYIFMTQNVQFFLDNLPWVGVYLLDLLFIHIKPPNQEYKRDWMEFIAHDEIRERVITIRKMNRFSVMQKLMDEFKLQFAETHSLD